MTLAEEKKYVTSQVSLLLSLEQLIPRHEIQVLNASFSDQLHYDKFAQKQSQLENLSSKLTSDSNIHSVLNNYKQQAFNYIQLVSMMKTSVRLISSEKINDLSAQLNNQIEAIKLLVFQFLSYPTAQIQLDIKKEINLLAIETSNSPSVQYGNLFKLHVKFIIENHETSAKYRKALINSPIIALLFNESKILQKQLDNINRQQLLSIFTVIISLLLLFINILRLHQNELKRVSIAHKNALEVKSQFLANMSHEIRTPMTGILGLVTLCLQSELNEEQRDYLEKMEFSATSLLRIINDILDFSKYDSGQFIIENHPFDHAKVFDNLVTLIAHNAEEKNIEFIFDIDPNIPTNLEGDPVRVSQILLNLLSNSIKFTQKGYVLLTCELLENKESDNSVFIEYKIEDSGIGLSEEQQKKLFKRFSQADESTTRKYGGTGLGLAICKLLIEQMKGTVTVESELDKGAKFTVIIPFLKSNKDTDLSQPVSLKLEKPMKLLLIEDNVITQNVIDKMASYLGASVSIANNVSQGIELCKQINFDVALIDWNLKTETGLGFIKKVQNESYHPKQLFVFSAYSNEYIEARCDQSLSIKYLSKPVTLFGLSQALKSKETDLKKVSRRNKLNVVPEKKLIYKQTTNKANNSILLVEDNKINQIVASEILKSLGLCVDIAENGKQAIELINNGQYPLVLMDIQMPVLDGIEATKILRKTYSAEQLKIVALTANIISDQIDYYAEIGMNGYLGKPYEIEKIKAVVDQYYALTTAKN
ncbi:response regulator [Pseudoalteromonas sp. C2R02]|uniref:response regulator n=1 Tax=Pseudoalteromonas sp. C2R02 TaxID=2841565 RepID=UPI001C0827FE|nr:response regulator [Pseudoalteromonas sp. C2R02]